MADETNREKVIRMTGEAEDRRDAQTARDEVKVVGTISTSSIMPGMFLETQDGKVVVMQGLIAMSDGTIRWRA